MSDPATAAPASEPPVAAPAESAKPDEETPGADAAAAPAKAEAWAISFSSGPKKGKRKVSKKEREALTGGNRVEAGESDKASTLAEVDVDALADPAIAIPRNLPTTQADMAVRTHFDVLRFQCVSRPQYKRTCGVSSLTSVWNYLYSRLGPTGSLPPVSQEEVMSILGFQPPFDNIRWGSFTGNTTLMRWFHSINAHFGVTGKAYYAWKSHGLGKTFGVTDEAAEKLVKDGLRSPHHGFIYHCHNHYMVPVGYQDQPKAQIHAYAPSLQPGEYEPYLFIGEVSRGKHSSLHIKKFSDVATDINCQSPNYFNIRHADLGVQQRRTKRTGGNLHCFLAFRNDVAEENMAQFEGGDEEADASQDDDEEAQEPERTTPVPAVAGGADTPTAASDVE